MPFVVLLVATAVACAVALALAGVGSAAVYYVDPSGDDRNSGRSPSTAWRSVGQVNSADLQPGDRVLFKAGASWREALSPTVSGRRSAPISFASYGLGKASLDGGIFLMNVRWLRFEGLEISGTKQAVLGSATGGGSRNIVLRRLAISDVEIGVNSANPGDRKWLIESSTIRRTQDSAIIVLGSRFRIQKNTIADAGQAADIPFAKHGVYLKGPSGRVTRNTIQRVSDAGVTTRFPNAIIQWNRITAAATGISYFQNAARKGRSIVRHNTIANVTDGIFLSSSSAERFFVHGNTVRARRNGLHTKKLRGLWVWDNSIKAPDRHQFDGPRVGRPPADYVDPSVPRLATLHGVGLVSRAGSKRPHLRARIGCRSNAANRCVVSLAAHVGTRRVASGFATIRKGSTRGVSMRLRRTAVRADASARRPTQVSIIWTARDRAGRKTIDHDTVRVRL